MEVNRLCSLMSGFRSTVHTKSFFLLLLFSLICFDSCTDVRTHQTLFLFLLNMASFFSETTNLLYCFTPHTFPRISQPSNAYNSLFLAAYLCHFFLVFLAHSLGCHSEICQETNESCGDTKSWIYCIVLQKKCPPAHLPASKTFLSVLWLCTSDCLAMFPWQPPVSSLGDTHCACSAVAPRYLCSQFAAQECVWVFVCC